MKRNVYDAALADLPYNEIRRGEITAFAQVDDAIEAFERCMAYFDASECQVVDVDEDDDPAVPGQTAYFPRFSNN